jgi:hypothetical protein
MTAALLTMSGPSGVFAVIGLVVVAALVKR